MTGLRIAVAAGGTGGHILPALALFHRLRQDPAVAAVRFVCRPQDLELTGKLAEIRSELVTVSGSGMPRSAGAGSLRFVADLFRAWRDSARFVREFRPHLLVSFGGYIGFMPALSARLAGARLVLLEQNSVPGLANRMLYPLAHRTILNFRHALKWFKRAVVIGNPSDSAIGRADRSEALRYFGCDPLRRTVLVTGGSQGAKGLNTAVIGSLALLSGYTVLWLTGRKHFGEVSRLAGNRPEVILKDFTDRMDLAWAAADIAVCRAGAATLTEMRLARVPAILVPFPHATEDHQWYNAKEQEEAGLARVVREENLAPETIGRMVLEMFETYGMYRKKFDAIDEGSATDRIAAAVVEMAAFGRGRK